MKILERDEMKENEKSYESELELLLEKDSYGKGLTRKEKRRFLKTFAICIPDIVGRVKKKMQKTGTEIVYLENMVNHQEAGKRLELGYNGNLELNDYQSTANLDEEDGCVYLYDDIHTYPNKKNDESSYFTYVGDILKGVFDNAKRMYNSMKYFLKKDYRTAGIVLCGDDIAPAEEMENGYKVNINFRPIELSSGDKKTINFVYAPSEVTERIKEMTSEREGKGLVEFGEEKSVFSCRCFYEKISGQYVIFREFDFGAIKDKNSIEVLNGFLPKEKVKKRCLELLLGRNAQGKSIKKNEESNEDEKEEDEGR
jgi:hypothetical protein